MSNTNNQHIYDLPKEKQYSIQFESLKKHGTIQLGPTCSHLWRTDPRHLCFLLSRYKFCSKLLAERKNVLEIGSGDSFGLRLVLQTVEKIHAIDFDPLFIEWAKNIYKNEKLNVSFQNLDIINEKPNQGPFDGIYALDFIEHIDSKYEEKVLKNICEVLTSDAICIFGTPNITAHKYASIESLEGHINLKNASSLKSLLSKYFENVLIFSMNDEIVHTGFYPMANYLFGVAMHPRQK